jgi:hypothetical protein
VASESKFERDTVKEIQEDILPGSVVLKNDAARKQGIPDRIVLYKSRWAMLEFKKSASAPKQPNQQHYIDKFGEMSYASLIYPENKEEVLNALQLALGPT